MLPKESMKRWKFIPLILFAIAPTSLFSVRPAQAYTVTLEQVGSNVVANGSGAFNLIGLTQIGHGCCGSNVIAAASGFLAMAGPALLDEYIGYTGPASFGSGGEFPASFGSGDLILIDARFGFLDVPQGYVSGAALSSSATWNNATFASLGVTPGTYVWAWGTGLPNQNFTLIIGGAGVPDGGTTVSLLGCALLGLAALRRKLSC
jgi:VPDSG-CTERM motif